MKKILAFVLATSLCIGVTALGFAEADGTPQGRSAIPPGDSPSSSSSSSSSDPSSSSSSSSSDPSSSSSSSSSSNPSSSSSSSSTSTTPSDDGDNTGTSTGSTGGISTGSTTSSSGTVTETAVTTAVTKAIDKAVSNNGASATAVLKNVPKVSANTLKSVAKKVAKASTGSKVTPKVGFDTVKNGAVVGRVTIDLTKVANISGNVNLGVSTTNKTVSKTFSKFFANETALVDLAHKTSFGTDVEIAVKVDLGKLNADNLMFYCYDAKANTYFKMDKANYFVDANGYVHFTTNMGGSIIITDSALRLKK